METSKWRQFVCLAGRPVGAGEGRWVARFVRRDPVARDLLLATPRAVSFAVAAPLSFAMEQPLLVAVWLAGIIVNLLLVPGYFDVALRDFGLLVGAVALQRLATARHGASTRSAQR